MSDIRVHTSLKTSSNRDRKPRLRTQLKEVAGRWSLYSFSIIILKFYQARNLPCQSAENSHFKWNGGVKEVLVMEHPFHLPRTPGLRDMLSRPSSKEAVNSESRPQILTSAQVWGLSHVSPWMPLCAIPLSECSPLPWV